MAEPWTVEAVALHFADAADTARRLPPVRMQAYRSSWPQFAWAPCEALARDDDRPLSLPPSPQAVERMLQAMQWVQWLEVEQRHLMWLRAKRRG
ncbi:DUF6362 family protein [Eleftheria terrae]|uniref:DUF6362 family protein n=1 Tax=Eleftheria terrae TaxID=1597781 RepID=UPI00344061E1